MRIYREQKGFQPVILSLETQEEAMLFWILANYDPTESMKTNAEDNGVTEAELSNFWTELEIQANNNMEDI